MKMRFLLAPVLVAALWVSPHFFVAKWSSNNAQAEDAVTKMKNHQEEIRQLMLSWSDQLNITCNECHNVKDFTEGSKRNFKIAKQHAAIVDLLKQQGFNGKPQREASCTMCHMGRLKPQANFKK